MSTLSDLLAEHTDLPGNAVDHLPQVVGEWQLLADLSFADVLLWVATERPEGTDGAMPGTRRVRRAVPADDRLHGVSRRCRRVRCLGVVRAPAGTAGTRRGEIVSEVDRTWRGGTPLRREAVPVRCDGEVIAVLSRDTNLAQQRAQSPLEIAYLDCAGGPVPDDQRGDVPQSRDALGHQFEPPRGRRFIRLDPAGRVVYSSPNALSAYHRMG